MIRITVLLCSIVALISSGCCAPALTGGCSDCDGVGFQQTIPCGPLDNFQQMKRNLICGGGCGETYIGEWSSTPPDCTDPCNGPQWIGGAVAANPFCNWQPGMFLGSLWGQRFCDGCSQPQQSCGCGGEVIDSYGGEFIDGGVIDGGTIGGGCSTCQTGHGSAAGLAQHRHQRNFVQQTARAPRVRTRQQRPIQQQTQRQYAQQGAQRSIQTGAIQTGANRTASNRNMAYQSGPSSAETARLKAQLREARAIEAELESRINGSYR